jgi:hypothetical protein
MQRDAVPRSLREQLGVDATEGLIQLFEVSHRQWRADVMAACAEHFERRLGDEVAGLRVQIAQTEGVLRRDTAETGAAIRQDMAEIGAAIREEMSQMGASIRVEMAQMGATIREEMAQMGATIREEMAQMGASIRVETAQMGASIRQEIAAGRVEMLKWCFLLWIGQVVAIASILGVMLRAMSR